MDFFTNNGYTDYPTVLTIISNLQEDELINVSVTSSNTSYSITPKGKEMLDFFGSKISDDIKNEIDSFLRDNRYELKQTANTTADYYKTTNGDYAVHCIVKENNAPMSLRHQHSHSRCCAPESRCSSRQHTRMYGLSHRNCAHRSHRRAPPQAD